MKRVSESKKGVPRLDMIGKIPWNSGKTKDSDDRLKKVSELKKNQVPWNKGKITDFKGKTYEEIYGVEKAKELKEKRRKAMLLRWNKS